MPRRTVAVVGGLSEDQIHLFQGRQLRAGTARETERHDEEGGLGGNIAIALSRSLHRLPLENDDGFAPYSPYSDDSAMDVEVRMVGAVANEHWQERFQARMRRNGVNADGIVIKGGDRQDYCTTFVTGGGTEITQAYGYAATNQWTIDDFPDIEAIGGGARPDVVIITQELQRHLVDHIVDLVNQETERVEIVLYASPGELLNRETYAKIDHLILNRYDACVMFGYSFEQLDADKWPEIVQRLYDDWEVKNVVLKLGHVGAFFINDSGADFKSGFRRIQDVVDESGATPAFVGAYVGELLRFDLDDPRWRIETSVQRGNLAAGVVMAGAGTSYQDSIPWGNELEQLDNDEGHNPIYPSLEDVRRQPARTQTGRRTNR